MKSITCCFTGHRKLPPGSLEQIRHRTAEEIKKAYISGYRRFLCGGALGYDTMCALEVIRMRQRCPDVKLILVYPCLGQDARWQERDREIYKHIYDECDECYCMSEKYTQGCMHLRNRAMVNESSLVIAYLTSDSGGTAYTYNYARQKGVRTVNVARTGGENER